MAHASFKIDKSLWGRSAHLVSLCVCKTAVIFDASLNSQFVNDKLRKCSVKQQLKAMQSSIKR